MIDQARKGIDQRNFEDDHNNQRLNIRTVAIHGQQIG